MEAFQNAGVKIQEAAFFLRLMKKVEAGDLELLQDYSREQQFSYLYSAFLNSCYSAVRQLRGNNEIKQKARDFLRNSDHFYKSGPNGGARTKSVYFKPVFPRHEGYIPPPGDQVILSFDDEPYGPPLGDAAFLGFPNLGRFYETNERPQNSICDLCSVHLQAICKLIQDCKVVA